MQSKRNNLMWINNLYNSVYQHFIKILTNVIGLPKLKEGL
jgi:hypothetical protein